MRINHPLHQKGSYYMEDALFNNLIALPNRIKKDKDVLGVFVGSPGEGKSTIAQQCLYLLDDSITIKSIKYSYEEYVKYCLTLFENNKSRGKGVIHDEGKEALSAVSVMTKRTRNFMNFLYENRQMNMYQFILTGDFFDLPKSIVMQRTLFMVWVHEEGEFDNGYFKFYNRKDLKRLYVLGKKHRNMQASRYSLRGRFPKFYTVDEEEYRKLKSRHLSADRYLDNQKEKMMTLKDAQYLAMQRNPDNFKPSNFARVFNCNPSQVYKYMKEWEVGDWV